MNKKAQLETMQTIIVVFLVVILLSIGMILFYKFQINSLEQQKKEIQLKKFDSMLSTFPNSPELECSSFSQTKNCIDVLKVLSLKKLIEQDSSYYFKKLSYKKIQLKSIYPKENNNECTQSNLDDCGIWTIYNKPASDFQGSIIRRTPVSIYFPHDDSYGVGMLILEAYEIEI